MTTTPATQSLLPVTLEAWRRREIQDLGAAISKRNWHEVETAHAALRDKMDAVLIEASRQAHSLPGDGMREALESIRSIAKAWPATKPCNEIADIAAAALTPSALSGDAGEELYMRGYLKVPCEVEPEGERREALKAAAMLLAPYSGDPAGTPTRDGLVFLNAAVSPGAAKYFAALPSHKGAGE